MNKNIIHLLQKADLNKESGKLWIKKIIIKFKAIYKMDKKLYKV